MRLILSRRASLALVCVLATAPSLGSNPPFNLVIASQEPAASLTPVNEPPRLAFIPNQSVATDSNTGALVLTAGTTLVITVSATDPNPQDALTLSAFFGTEGTLPAGSTFTQINSGTGVFMWTPSLGQEGVWGPANAAAGKPALTLRVRDDRVPQLQDVQLVTISIGPSANRSPSLNLYENGTRIGVDSPILATEGDSIEFDLYCSDDNSGDVLSLGPSATTPLPMGATMTKVSTGHDNPVRYAFAWDLQTGQAGTRAIDFVCQDGGSPVIDERRRIVFEIAAPAAPPRILAISPDMGPPAGGTTVTITGTGLGATTDVQFGGASAPFTIVDTATVVFTTTPGVTGTLVDVGLTTPLGVATRVGAFQYNDYGDTDRDGISNCVEGTGNPDGDSSVNLNDTDSDGDGIPDAAEAIGQTGRPTVSVTCGGVSFAIADTDGDGTPDFFDIDSDSDGISDRFEGASDMNSNGIPNYRDVDSDGDSAADAVDNCPSSPNAGQADTDVDGVGDVCDYDTDNDGLSNALESVYGTNPSNPDTDGDSLRDGDEVFVWFTNPLVADSVDEDSVPPAITMTAPAVVEATSPAGAPVTYTANGVDDVDGAVEVDCSPVSGSTFAIGSTTVLCEAQDDAGNLGTAEVTTEVVDTTAPQMTCPAPLTVEATSAAGAAVAFGDAVAIDLVTPALHIAFSQDPGSTFALGETVVTATATDAAGNSSACTVTIDVVDTTPPAITILAPEPVGYTLDQTIQADYFCIDAASGIASCTGPVLSGSAIETTSLGSKMFSVTASDHVGNRTTQSVSYTVGSDAVGYGACLLYDPARAARAGSTIPIRFQLCSAAGQNVSSADRIVRAVQVLKISNSSTSGVIDAGNANPDTDFRFDPSLGGSGGYIFNLKTSGLSPGQYVVAYQVQGDPTVHASDLVFHVR